MPPDFTPSPRLYPFTSRSAETSVGRVHYVDEGQGRPMVLLHGNPTWSFLYRNLIPALRDIPSGVVRTLSDAEMEALSRRQATPEDRQGVAELPRQIVTAAPWLAELERTVAARLGDKPVLVTWPRCDVAFPAQRTLARLRAALRDVTVVELGAPACPDPGGRSVREVARTSGPSDPDLGSPLAARGVLHQAASLPSLVATPSTDGSSPPARTVPRS